MSIGTARATVPSAASSNDARMERLVHEIERSRSTRAHARHLRDRFKDLSGPLFHAIAAGSAGAREAQQVRQLLGLKR